MAGLSVEHVGKQYKKTGQVALHDINLNVSNDEFLVILGPSGCGKTTLLRMIAGLESATEGDIFINGQRVNDLEPQQRGIGMVFQNYALYPHMSISDNLAFALKIAKKKKAERTKAIQRVADILDIRRFLKKKPHMLSGGERQRVAMGRAMINECRLYLLDEPLSNIDDHLRTALRPEILRLFHKLQVPFLYVTHDQIDAMTMGTKVAVMQAGRIEQIGTPQEIYNHPSNVFVAGFVGTPQMNFLSADVMVNEGETVLQIGNVILPPMRQQSVIKAYIGKQVTIGIRPEDFLTGQNTNNAGNLVCLNAALKEYEYLGNKVNLLVEYNKKALWVTAPPHVRARINQTMDIFLDVSKVHLFDAQTGLRL